MILNTVIYLNILFFIFLFILDTYYFHIIIKAYLIHLKFILTIYIFIGNFKVKYVL